ncbi:hypothetical protein TSAR_004110, partial [Trichomalopsis sarcophagae]
LLRGAQNLHSDGTSARANRGIVAVVGHVILRAVSIGIEHRAFGRRPERFSYFTICELLKQFLHNLNIPGGFAVSQRTTSLYQLHELMIEHNFLKLVKSKMWHVKKSTFESKSKLEAIRLDDNFFYDINNAMHRDNFICELKAFDFEFLFQQCQLYSRTSLHSSRCARLHGKQLITFPVWQLNVNETACSNYFFQDSVMKNIMVSDYLLRISTILLTILMLLMYVVLAFIFLEPVRIGAYSCYGTKAAAPEDKDNLYDDYVCYNFKNKEFVLHNLAVKLEHSIAGLQLCVHHQDLP